MKAFFVVALYACVASAQEIAYVDLTAPSKSSPSVSPVGAGGTGSAGGSGGAFYDGQDRTKELMKATLPVSLRMIRLSESTDQIPWEVAIELLLTNTSLRPIRIPIGPDSREILKASAHNRQSLGFLVLLDARPTFAGFGQAASNDENPETTLEVKPGESIRFKISFDTRVVANEIKERGEVEARLSVSVVLSAVETHQGVNYTRALSLPIQSKNSLPWAPSNEK